MIGAISNPTKKLVVDFPIDKVRLAVRNINKIEEKFEFESENSILNSFKFRRFEFLSSGVFVNIQLNSISENKTEINIEIARVIGAFDQAHEVTKANKHIDEALNAIANIIANGVPTEKLKKEPKEVNLTLAIVLTIVCFPIGLVLLYQKFFKAKTA